jgi:hypothetical protein
MDRDGKSPLGGCLALPGSRAVTREEGERLWKAEVEKREYLKAVVFVTAGSNDFAAELVARNPGKFIAYAHHDPCCRCGGAPREGGRAGRPQGLQALGPKIDRPLDDRSFDPIWEVAQSHDIPILVHFGISAGGAGSPACEHESLRIHDVAKRFPRMPIIIPHFGCGYLFETLNLAWACPNVSIDTQAPTSGCAGCHTQWILRRCSGSTAKPSELRASSSAPIPPGFPGAHRRLSRCAGEGDARFGIFGGRGSTWSCTATMAALLKLPETSGGKMMFSSVYQDRVIDAAYRNWSRLYQAEFWAVQRAHLVGLAKTGIIEADIASALAAAIERLRATIAWPEAIPRGFEDMYFVFEHELETLVGPERAAFLHTARSRNDMDNSVFRLALRKQLLDLSRRMLDSLGAILDRARGAMAN